MIEFIQNLIGNEYIATSIMSIVPMIELKGGIVFARGAGIGLVLAFLLAYSGSTVAFFPVFFLLQPILSLLKKIKCFNKFAIKIENYFKNKAEETLNKQSNKKVKSEKFLKQLGVFIFVAVPLPMTGVWTGTAIAVFLGLKFKESVLPVALGNIVAGVIISLLAELCMAIWSIESLNYILYGLFILAVIILIFTIIKVSRQKNKGSE